MLRRHLLTSAAVLSSLLATLPAHARQVGGAHLPEAVRVEDERLQLNGAARHKHLFADVYAMGLYLEEPTRSAQQVLASEQTKQLQLHALRDLPREKVIEAMKTGLSRAVPPQQRAQVAPHLPRLFDTLPDIRKGDALVMTYSPGEGSTIVGPENRRLRVPGKAFADALLSIWLGPNKDTRVLRRGLLGG